MKFLILFLTALLYGCAVSQHAYSTDGKCLTCVNNPITGKPINYNPEQDAGTERHPGYEPEPTHSAGSIAFQVPYDVEHAYYVVQREFSFPEAADSRGHLRPHRSGSVIDPELAKDPHRRNFDVPGKFRYSQAFREHGTLHLVVGVKIRKVDHRTSKITVSYLSDDPTLEVWDISRSLRERVRSALEYYSCDNIQRDYDNRYRYSDPCR